MPEHVHILIRPQEPDYDVSRVLSRIKRRVARQALEYLRLHAPAFLDKLTRTRLDGTPQTRFWQAGGGYDRNVVEATTVRKMIDYIHDNPVRRGLVERPEDWAWSSFRWYAGLTPILLEMDRTLPPVYELLRPRARPHTGSGGARWLLKLGQPSKSRGQAKPLRDKLRSCVPWVLRARRRAVRNQNDGPFSVPHIAVMRGPFTASARARSR